MCTRRVTSDRRIIRSMASSSSEVWLCRRAFSSIVCRIATGCGSHSTGCAAIWTAIMFSTISTGTTARAFEMVVGGNVERAFDLASESDATRELYGRNSIGEKAMLARRLVEAGVTFVLVSGAWGYFDHHGDSVKWGGIVKGLTPFCRTSTARFYGLVSDLDQRGLLDSTLVLMMGEFGRSPVINKDAGRDHWTNVMSMVAAGGGLRHGQAVGSTDSKGYDIKDGLVRPQDLAATVFRHLGIDLGAQWINPQGTPIPIVVEGGRPIPELV